MRGIYSLYSTEDLVPNRHELHQRKMTNVSCYRSCSVSCPEYIQTYPLSGTNSQINVRLPNSHLHPFLPQTQEITTSERNCTLLQIRSTLECGQYRLQSLVRLPSSLPFDPALTKLFVQFRIIRTLKRSKRLQAIDSFFASSAAFQQGLGNVPWIWQSLQTGQARDALWLNLPSWTKDHEVNWIWQSHCECLTSVGNLSMF